jgi:hypothetical protein
MAPLSSEEGVSLRTCPHTLLWWFPRLSLGGSPPLLPMDPVGVPLMGETRIPSLKQKANTCGAGKQHRSVQIERAVPSTRRRDGMHRGETKGARLFWGRALLPSLWNQAFLWMNRGFRRVSVCAGLEQGGSPPCFPTRRTLVSPWENAKCTSRGSCETLCFSARVSALSAMEVGRRLSRATPVERGWAVLRAQVCRQRCTALREVNP